MASDVTPVTVAISDSGSHSFNVLHWIGHHTFKLYSSVPGGQYINNSSYSIFGVDKYQELAPSYLVGTNDPAVNGGNNLTVITKGAMVQGYESGYGTSAPLKAFLYINGGNYEYSGKNAFARVGGVIAKNATITTTGAASTVFLNHFFKAATLTLENLTVIAKNASTTLTASGDSSSPATAGLNAQHTITITNVTLIGKGLKPVYNVNTAGKLAFTVDGVLTNDADIFAFVYPEAPEGKVLAYAGLLVDGEIVLIKGYVAADKTVTVVNAALNETKQWIADDQYVFVIGDAADASATKTENGWYHYTNPVWFALCEENAIALDAICATDNAGKTIAIAVTGDEFLPLAFAYRLDGGALQLIASLGSPKSDGESFYNLLNDKNNVQIVMYSDIVLTKGVLFGTFTEWLDKAYDNKSYQILAKDNSGNVDWDLNGCTVTMEANATGLPIVLTTDGVDANKKRPTHSVLHFVNMATFKLYSSVPGGEYINNSTLPIFGIHKYDVSSSSIILGTNDSAVNGGDNLKITSLGTISCAYETQGNGPLGFTLYINGGTYVYSGNQMAFICGGKTNIYNAKIITMNAALGAVVNHYWSATTLHLEGCSIIAKNAATRLVDIGMPGVLQAGTNPGNYKSQKISVKDCSFFGGVFSTKNLSGIFEYAFEGTIKLDSPEKLELVYAEIPAENLVVCDSFTINGEYAKVYMYAPADVAALVDWGFGMQEYWAIGATATRDITIVDEIFAYEFAPIPVTASEHKATATLVAIYPGAMQMSLTLHSYIGLNLMLNPEALVGATVTLNGEAYNLAELGKVNGIYVITASIAPNKAAESIELSIQINDHTHTIPVGIGAYAKAVLGNEAYANAHDMTYAMVEYVRAMNPGAGFLDGVELEGYEAKTIPESGVASGASGCQIAFCLDDTIAIAVSGAGESIVLKLPSGRVLQNPAVVDGVALFDELAVNELAAGFTVEIGEASYTYSLVDYYYAIDSAESLDENQKDFYVSVIEALYSYSQYAFEYARDYK